MEFKQEVFTEPREGIDLEYKKSSRQLPRSFWDTYSSFANTKGGLIILGIDEVDNNNYKVVGVENPNTIIRDLWNGVHNTSTVNVNLLKEEDVYTRIFFGKTLIYIHIPKANFEQRPVYTRNSRSNTFIRTDDGDRKADDQQFKYLIVDSQNDIDSELLENYGIDDLNLEDVLEYKKLLANNSNKPNLLEKDNFDFLREIGVFKKNRQQSNSKYYLTSGGLLFFGKFNSITDRFKKFQLDYFKKNSSLDVDWADRISSGDMNYPELNIFSFYRLVMAKLKDSVPDKYIQDENLTRGSYHSDLTIALKEGLVNSLMHAYYDSDMAIKIYNYSDYIEFYNPGEMRVSKEEFIHGSSSVTRNSVISMLFRKVGIAEKAASGGPRIIETATRNHLRFPDIVKDYNSTTLRIWKINMIQSLDGLDPLEKAIMEFAIDNGMFKVKDIVKRNPDYTEYKIRATIDSLVKKEKIVKRGKGKSTHYILNRSEEFGIIGLKRMLKMFEDDISRNIDE